MLKPDQQRPGPIVLFCSMIVAGLLSPLATAEVMSHGEMAGAIRSANYPCAHVIKIDSAGDNAWVVQCNSGKFNVSRDQNGNFQVTQTE